MQALIPVYIRRTTQELIKDIISRARSRGFVAYVETGKGEGKCLGWTNFKKYEESVTYEGTGLIKKNLGKALDTMDQF